MNKKAGFLNKDLYYYYIFLIVAAFYIYSFSREEGFLLINQLHSDFFDALMPLVTLLGDGWFAVIIALLFSIYKIRYSIFLLLSYAMSGITVQILKRLVFPERLRPLAWFSEHGIDIYTIESLDIPSQFSFPSGHSATAFALFIGISFLLRSWYLKLLLLLLAIFVGLSRVYLAVHFPVDVVAGSLLGVMSSFICFNWVSGWKKGWLDVSLGTRIFNSGRL